MSVSSINNRTTVSSSTLDLVSLVNSQKKSTSSTETQETSSKSSEMRDLIDKVASGTATEAEIAQLASKLKEMAADLEKRFSSTTVTDETATDSEMKSLLEKIANGTATDEEIKTIAEKMQERANDMQAHFGGGMPPAAINGTVDEEFKTLVDAVAAGTASDSEIEALAAKLKEMAEQMENQLADASSADSSTASSNSEMDSLMAKILNGTATDEDVEAIATLMKSRESEIQASVATSLEAGGGLLAQQLLDSMMQSYEQTESNYTLPTGETFSV